MSNDGDIESSQRSFNGVSSSQVITTLQKNKQKEPTCWFFRPSTPWHHHLSSHLDRDGAFLRALQVGIAKITGKAFVDGQKVLEVKEFTCDSVLSHWFFRVFVALPHRSLRSFQMFVGSLYEKK